MKIAVIGSGISGLSAAYFLSKKHKVDLFEKEDRFGGHSHTLDILTDNQIKKKIRADIGFIVFNKQTYPNLINFFNEIGVEIEKSNMSLSFLVKKLLNVFYMRLVPYLGLLLHEVYKKFYVNLCDRHLVQNYRV